MSSADSEVADQDRITAVAAELLATVGPGFTIAELLRRTKLSRATLYRKIGSKHALLEGLKQRQGSGAEPSVDTNIKILRAARTVFGQRGLAGATMEQIAAAADVGVATLYRRFKTKDGLVRAFVEQVSPRVAVSSIASHPTADVHADLVSIAATLLSFVQEQHDVLRVIFGGTEADDELIDRLRQAPSRSLDQLGAYFEAQVTAGRIRRAGQPIELALAFVGLVLAFALVGPRLYGQPSSDNMCTASLVVDVFLHGSEARPAEPDRFDRRKKA